MTIRKLGLAAIAACLPAFTPVLAQEEETPNADGSLSGTVVSAASKAGIEGALLTFSGGPEPRYASSDEVGGFVVVLPAGSYTLSVFHSSYASPPDREITIRAGIAQNLTIPLSREAAPSQQAMEEIVVLGAYRPTALTRSRDSESVVDVLSSEDFAITGDSTAVDALARVPGLTVVNSKYVYVRGLGERYSNTVFNGSPLPSPDPTRRVIPMDMFPTGALENVDIQKTYSPNLPGDFSGGMVAMATRGAPAERVLELSVGIGGNSQATGDQGLDFEGGDRDWLGMDDGTRDLPAELNRITDNGAVSLNLVSDEERAAAGRSLNRTFDTELQEIDPGVSISGRWGGGTEVGGGDLGFLLSARYSNDWSYRDEERRTFGLSGASDDLSVLDEGAQSRTQNTLDLSLLGNVEWDVNASTFLRSTTFVTRRTDRTFLREFDFFSENDIHVADTTLEFVERQLLSQQVAGEHFFESLRALAADWSLTWSVATREEPDTLFYRFERFNEAENLYALSDTGQSNERSWEDLEDEALNYALNLSLPIEFGADSDGEISVGLSYLDKERDSYFRRFRFLTDFSRNNLRTQLGQTPDLIFADELIAEDLWELQETTQPTDNYAASHSLSAAYAMADLNLGMSWRWMFGARFEDSTQDVTTFELIDPTRRSVRELAESSLLPATTLTWLPGGGETQQIRLGYSRTLNRPDLKELSEAPYIDPEERYTVVGNPDLQVASIDNLDLRWEYFFDNVNSVQVAAFHKKFEDPIERVIRLGAGGIRTFANAESATLQGVEVQLRAELGLISDALQDFEFRLNAALVDSEVDIGSAGAQQTSTERELEGQSPWVANVQFSYDNPDLDLQAALLFNMAGERIVDVGTQGLPDSYEQPVARLDFNYRQAVDLFGLPLRIQLKIRNILDEDYEVLRGSSVERLYTRGRSVSLSVDVQF